LKASNNARSVFRDDGARTQADPAPRMFQTRNAALRQQHGRATMASHDGRITQEDAMPAATNFFSSLFGAQSWKNSMTKDADRLMRELGTDAYVAAADLAWREDMGLVSAPHGGHWSRVTLEIGRRLAIAQLSGPVARLPPRLRAENEFEGNPVLSASLSCC
jgi:hypothetical protein